MATLLNPTIAALSAKKQELESLLLVQDRVDVRENLPTFIRGAWPIIEPGTELNWNWHIDAIAEYLTACRRGQITRLIINIPPRYGKSIFTTVMFPCWTWASWPESRFMFISYSQSLSNDHSVARRTILQSPWYQARWGDLVSLRGDQNLKMEFRNNRRGVMTATSVGGTATGKGGNFLVVDDPHNPSQALSDVQRQEAITFIDQTLSTRLDDTKKGVIIVIMQRLHERDATGHLLAKGGWEQLRLPAEAETKERIVFPLSGKVHEREPGEPLWLWKHGKEELKRARIDMTSYGYAGQMQQRPVPPEGAMLKREWFKRYKRSELPKKFDEWAQFWDCAFKDTDGSDYVVGQVWARAGAKIYLIFQVRARLDLPATCKAVMEVTAKYPQASLKMVEDKANGPAVIQSLKEKIPGLVEFPKGEGDSKIAMYAAASPMIESGNVLLPEEAEWVDEFLAEVTAVPKSMYDDQADAMAMAIKRLLGGAGGLYNWLAGEAERVAAEHKARVEKENRDRAATQVYNVS